MYSHRRKNWIDLAMGQIDFRASLACGQYQQWLAAGLILPNIAVNLSARQLSQPTLIAKSDRILERTEMKPKYL